MSYQFGFSWKGLLVFLLTMLPNIIYFLRPNLRPSAGTSGSHLALDIIEHGSQAVFILLLVFLTSAQASPIWSPYTLFMAMLLLVYYGLWAFYFFGNINFIQLLGMAIVPVAYFVLAEIWLHIFPAIIPTAIFGAVHIIITYVDYSSSH